MSPRLLLGIDLGGGSVRCLLLDADTGAHTAAAVATGSYPCEATGGLGYELDGDELWTRVGEGVARGARARGVAGDAVVGVSVTAMRFASVLLDDAGLSAVRGAEPRRARDRRGIPDRQRARRRSARRHRDVAAADPRGTAAGVAARRPAGGVRARAHAALALRLVELPAVRCARDRSVAGALHGIVRPARAHLERRADRRVRVAAHAVPGGAVFG
jgi:hypothetical protein